MAAFKHYKAVCCIEKRIQDLNAEIIITQKVIDNTNMMADLHFAKTDLKNFKDEIESLRSTISYLITNNDDKHLKQ